MCPCVGTNVQERQGRDGCRWNRYLSGTQDDGKPSPSYSSYFKADERNPAAQVFLQSMDDFAAFNKLYAEFFAPYKPARSCVEVAKLPLGVRCEMEFIALEK